MDSSPAIVVVAFNRVHPLRRLLNSLGSAKLPNDTTLVISIDYSGDNRVEEVAREFEWEHGDKRIITHSENLGLRKHILKCGDLTEEFGSIILLEDDLFVSPFFYSYTQQAQTFYKDDKRIAGISLYHHGYNEYTGYPFVPLEDGYDNYFLQIASSSGESWTRQQWSDFKKWYLEEENRGKDSKIPNAVKAWPESSWKKYFIKYLVDTDKYFVYPRVSLTTNFGDIGTHFSNKVNVFQMLLLYGEKKFSFSTLSISKAVYDTYCELQVSKLKELAPALRNYNFACDLYASKELNSIEAEYLLTTRRLNAHPVRSFGLEMKPMELNLVYQVQGKEIYLYKTCNFSNELLTDRENSVLFKYFYMDSTHIPEYILSEEVNRIPFETVLKSIEWRIKNRLKFFLDFVLKRSS